MYEGILSSIFIVLGSLFIKGGGGGVGWGNNGGSNFYILHVLEI